MRGAGSPGRLAFLDGVRGTAALAVVAGHSGEVFFPGFARWSLDWFNLGRAGVCAFFLVSGFVIPISLERSGGVRDFAISRVCRLYPLYWFSLAAVLALPLVGVESLPADFEAELPASAVVNLTMAQELVGVPHAIGLYYTLTIELVWYLACVALFAVGWLHATPRLAWMALAGLAVVGVGGPLLLDRHTPFSTGFYLVTMLMGTALARHAAGTVSTACLGALLAATAAVAGAGAWANYLRVPGGIDPEGALGMTSTLLPWGVAYAGVLLAYSLRRRSHRYSRIPAALGWLGVVSYSVYLLHPLILDFTTRMDDAPWLQLGVTLAATVGAAALTHRWIEVPGQELGRRWRAGAEIRKKGAEPTGEAPGGNAVPFRSARRTERDPGQRGRD